MKFVLGFYSQVSHASPHPVFMRLITCILKPVLTYVHNNRSCRLSIACPSAMIKYLGMHFPEINLLVSTLAKCGSLELFTSAYNNTILPLIPHKDRSIAVDRTTTLIRKTYGVRATTLWCYGQIWAPSIVTMMKTIGLERLVISSYDALGQKSSGRSSFRMNEIGRKIDVLQANDKFSKAVSSYAQNEISLDQLKQIMREIVLNSDDENLTCMINLDQLCQGASYHREDDEELYTVFTSLFSAAQSAGADIILARDCDTECVGYLANGWYGRDAYANGLASFNDLFSRSEDFRFYLNRYLTLAEFASESKKDRVLRRRLQEMLSTLPSGSLFLCDTQASCLSLNEHRQYYKTLIDAENSLDEAGLRLNCADVDDDGLDEEFCYGRQARALFSLTGASVYEYSSKELGLNIFDTVPFWLKTFPETRKKRSFIDSYVINGREYLLGYRTYSLDSVNKSRSEFCFSYQEEDMNFSVEKHYKLNNQNLYMSHTLVNQGSEFLSGEYSTVIYFTLPGASAFAYNEKREPLVGSALSGIKNVRFFDSSRCLQLSFTSTDYFSVSEENRYQSEVTSLGSEQFYLYTKVKLTFKVSIAPQSAQSLNIVTRISSTKEK